MTQTNSSVSSGTGLLGFAAAYLGAEVTLTDTHVELMRLNAANNPGLQRRLDSTSNASTAQTAGTYQIRQYFWGADPATAGLQPPYDLVFCSDLVFITCRDRYLIYSPLG